MQRIYLQSESLGKKEIIVNDIEIIHQLCKVLRVNIGYQLIFFNGIKSIDFVYEIISLDKKNIIFQFIEPIQKNDEKMKIHLYQAIPNKIDKIELILQKGVEVGYHEFTFFSSERSQKISLSPNKILRFEKIILEAVEQTGRNSIPKLTFLDSLDYSNILGEKCFFHTESENSSLLKDLKNAEKINIFIGPEGGFSQKEKETFEKNNFTKVYLGNSILRTETVSIGVGFYLGQKFE